MTLGARESAVNWFDGDSAKADWTDECVFHNWLLLVQTGGWYVSRNFFLCRSSCM